MKCQGCLGNAGADGYALVGQESIQWKYVVLATPAGMCTPHLISTTLGREDGGLLQVSTDEGRVHNVLEGKARKGREGAVGPRHWLH
jgi:hypothetical protein